MHNFIISIIYLCFTFSLTTLCYKKFGKVGLFVWMMLSVVICNIQTIKLSEIGGFVTSLGNISYGAVFLTSDILSEKYGEKECFKAIKFSFLGMIVFTISMLLFLSYTPSKLDTSQEALSIVFSYMPRVTLASLTSYLISQVVDAKLYTWFKRKFKKVWISNNASTFISQMIDTFLFTCISFVGVLSGIELLELMITMLIFKWVIAFLDTPFMILVTKLKANEV